jgi:peptidyl-prolyl cis-trans isomerase B (cyclophilin B)
MDNSMKHFAWSIVVGIAALSLMGAAPARLAETKLLVQVKGKGTIEITLDGAKAPRTSTHVRELAQDGFYDGLTFFDVKKTPKPYLVKFGDPKARASGAEKASPGPIAFENTGLPNVRGAVGLSTKERDPNSGDSIFYISLAENRFLDGKYAVFGRVTSGMDVVDGLDRGDEVSSVTVVRG